jgi:hypothetical protein
MAAIAVGTEKLAGPVAAQNHDQPVMVQPQRAQRIGHTAAGGQQVRKRFAPQGDLHPFGLGEDAEADLTRLVGQLGHQLLRWAMEGLPVLIWFLLPKVLQQRQPPPGDCRLVVGTRSAHSVER